MSDNSNGISCPQCDKGTLRNTTTIRAGSYTRVRRVKCDQCGTVCCVVSFVVDTQKYRTLATDIRNKEARPVLAGRRIYPVHD